MGKAKKELKALRKKVPPLKCLPGCTDCCGPIVFAKVEWDAVHDKRTATSITCPYASDDGCDIYEHRPVLCRLFGAVPKMPCPHGCAPGKMLTSKEGEEIMKRYIELVSKGR